MDMEAFLDGESLTGNQAVTIALGFLVVVVLAGVALLLFGDPLADLFV